MDMFYLNVEAVNTHRDRPLVSPRRPPRNPPISWKHKRSGGLESAPGQSSGFLFDLQSLNLQSFLSCYFTLNDLIAAALLPALIAHSLLCPSVDLCVQLDESRSA